MPFEITTFPVGTKRFGDPDVPALEYAATGQTGPVEWSVSEGAMNPVNGDASILSPPNHTVTLVITAKDTGTDPWEVKTKTLELEATLPVVADWGVESDINPGFELSIPEKGPPKFRKIPRSAVWPLVFRMRQFMDYASLRDFLLLHETFPFWVEDHQTGDLRKVYQDSALRRVGRRTNWMEYSFQVRDYEYEGPANIADIGPFKPAGSSDEYGEGEYGG